MSINVFSLQRWLFFGLILTVIGLFFFNVWTWQRPMLDVSSWVEPLKKKSAQFDQVRMFKPNLKPYRVFAENFKKRNPFEPYSMKESIKKIDTTQVLKQLPAHLNIVGVLKGKQSQDEVIIEDRHVNETFFLTKEQSNQDVKLHLVTDSAIRLEYQNKIYEVPINP